MDISEQTQKWVVKLVIVLASLLIFFVLLDQLTGNRLIRYIACGALFWIPFGAIATAFTGACAAIPG